MPVWTLADLADAIDGDCLGDGSLPVETATHPSLVKNSSEMALILQAEAIRLLEQPEHPAAAALLPVGVEFPGKTGLRGAIRVQRPKLALARLLGIFEPTPYHQPGIHPSAVVEAGAQIDPTASIGALTYVGPQAVVGPGCVIMPHVTIGAGAVIGQDCLLHSGVRIGERVIIGNRVILQPNATIGADGFSYVTPEAGSIESVKSTGKVSAQNDAIIRIPSIGSVILEDDVEVGACATIDRANVGFTLIRQGTKIDNLVMIGHNNQVGQNCLIAGQTGIAGSCKVGNRVVMAGQVGLADHLTIGDDVILMAQTGVNKSVSEKAVMFGTPATPWRQAAEQHINLSRLKAMRQEIKLLQTQMAELQEKLV